jgi:hypothetical protein
MRSKDSVMTARTPSRLVPLAAQSHEELTHALDELDADGVTLTNVYGTGEEARSLGDDIFEPLWAELDRRHALVFLHGEQTPPQPDAKSVSADPRK